jgi:hypothetical protein
MGAGHEGSEESQANKASGTDSESFSNSGGSVTSSIERVSAFSCNFWGSGHFANTASVI